MILLVAKILCVKLLVTQFVSVILLVVYLLFSITFSFLVKLYVLITNTLLLIENSNVFIAADHLVNCF